MEQFLVLVVEPSNTDGKIFSPLHDRPSRHKKMHAFRDDMKREIVASPQIHCQEQKGEIVALCMPVRYNIKNSTR